MMDSSPAPSDTCIAMSDQYYRVVSINIPPREMEAKGSRRKFWVRIPEQGEWLVKFPRPNTGEHWAEKIAAELGLLLKIDTAHLELARSGAEMATICRSFLLDEDDPQPDDGPAITWFHGSDFLNLEIPSYNTNLVRSNRAHSVKNIINAILQITGAGSLNPMREGDLMMEDLASYAILDGLIGNTDRHHENWMVQHVQDAGDYRMYIAPSFDHASSLGRELLDERRELILSSNGVLNYLKKGRGGVFVDGNHRQAPSPLYLAQLICRLLRRWRPELSRTWMERLNSMRDTEIRSIIDRVPPEFMTDTAKEFTYQMVVTSKTELLGSIT